ncbi:hypothetical protein V6N13_085352 [Hibiscus sabdariffa]
MHMRLRQCGGRKEQIVVCGMGLRVCDAETGNVIGLDLSCSCLGGPFPSNNTLFLLRHLRRLNLAHNDFSVSSIASQFGQFDPLEISIFLNYHPLIYLMSLEQLWLNNNKFTGSADQFDKAAPLKFVDLWNSGIQGPIPDSFSQLVNHTYLDLSSNNLSGSFELDNHSNNSIQGQITKQERNWGSKLLYVDLSNLKDP